MFQFVLLTCVVASASAAGPASLSFDSWTRHHAKSYATKADADRAAKQFEANAALVAAHNSKASASYTLTVNGKFADMSFDDFSARYLQASQNCSATHRGSPPLSKLREDPPESVDWRNKGVVGPVKSQGHCGSCWTFSTSGTLESHHAIKTGEQVSLAEQQLVDCAGDFNNFGCNGGLPSQAFEYIRFAGGMETEDSYPYTAEDGKCAFDVSKVGATVSDVHNITALDEEELTSAVGLAGPVSIAFQVADDFHLYDGGVYDSTVCKSGPSDVNHAVVAVGYDTDVPSGKPFWIVRNSWGADWGMNGYFNIVRGKNMCGLADCASFPIV